MLSAHPYLTPFLCDFPFLLFAHLQASLIQHTQIILKEVSTVLKALWEAQWGINYLSTFSVSHSLIPQIKV